MAAFRTYNDGTAECLDLPFMGGLKLSLESIHLKTCRTGNQRVECLKKPKADADDTSAGRGSKQKQKSVHGG